MYTIREKERLHQGDILENFDFKKFKITENGLEMEKISFPFVVILSQECDLQWDNVCRNESGVDKNQDKMLQTILVFPAFLAGELKEGGHMNALGLKMERWSSDQWKIIKQNKNDRFHYLIEDSNVGISEIVIDFKHYYTISSEELYLEFSSNYKASLKELFREDLSRRFANYLSRIGLPEIKK
jgi:hypothetical protein